METYGYCILGSADENSDTAKDEVKEKRKKIRAYAVLNDIEVKHIFTEQKAHQFKPFNKRPKGIKLLKLIDGNIILIAYKLADIFNSPRQMLNTIELFKKRKIDLHVIETGGRLVFGNTDDITLILIKHFADFEKKIQQGKKTNNGVRGHRRRGKIPFGFKLLNGKLIEKPHEQSIIKEMNEMHNNGSGYLSIAKEIVEKHNVMFSHMGIKKILEREPTILEKQNDNNNREN